MSEWLRFLPIELDNLKESDLVEPNEPMGEKDQQLGDMSERTRRIYALGIMLDKRAHQTVLDANFCHDKGQRFELETLAHELLEKARVLKSIMWIGIRDEFRSWGGYIGVRVGYKVVTQPDSNTADGLPPFLRQMLGL